MSQYGNRFARFLSILFSYLVLTSLCLLLGFYFLFQNFNKKGPSLVAQTFLVKTDTSLVVISRQLEDLGLLRNSLTFRLGCLLYRNERDLKAGEYEIPARASMKEIMDVLKSGKSIVRSITIPEGMTVEQAMMRVESEPSLSGNMPGALPLEGEILADTHHFVYGTPREKVIQKMLEDQKALVKEIWEKRAADLPIKDINEFVTLASIVEKETSVPQERSRVAAVFINRLKKGMRLQSDPTIIYGLFGGKGKPSDRPIFQSDINKSTPYNTYVIEGLPPTPIANPGRQSLEAVSNPAKTDDLYFVADGTGGHVFAKTLNEHNKNVSRWRKIQTMK